MLSPQEKQALIELLKKIDPNQPYGTELFNALAKVSPSVAMEAVCLRLNNQTQQAEVYLTKRALNDTAYPGQWHCPGSVMRPGEQLKDVFDRLSKQEFDANILVNQFVTNINNPHEARGHFFSVVYLCSLNEKANKLKGSWFSIDQLPENTVKIHRQEIIPAAIKVFTATNPINFK